MQNKNRRRVEIRAAILALVFIFSLNFVSAIKISEIMYNLPGNDAGREWIEIYNNEIQAINLSGWKFYDTGNHNLNLINGSWIFNSGDYAIIADNSNTFLNENPTFNGNIFDSSFSLGNSNATIALKNNSLVIVESMTYFSNWGAAENNNSLQLINGEWCEGLPTPGRENNCNEQPSSNDTIDNPPADNETTDETPTAEEKNCDNATVLAITSIPYSAMFGSKKEIGLKFNSTCYDYDSIKFLVYGTGSRIISDAQGNKITKYSGCENGTELQVSETIYDLNIPFFTYPNCNKYYKDGSYSVALRICRPSWEKYSENIFSIEISGLNSSICTNETREFIFESNGTETDAENEIISPEERLLNAPKLDENKKAETTATADVVYESKGEKIKNSAIYWLLGASVALSIYLIVVKIK